MSLRPFVGQQNDFKTVMRRIEALLPEVLPAAGGRKDQPVEGMRPFARLGVVPTDSVAYASVWRVDAWRGECLSRVIGTVSGRLGRAVWGAASG